MDAADFIAAYGAIVASGLAILQVFQWRRAQKFVSVKYTEFYYEEDSTIEVTITNRGQHNVNLDFVAVGYSARFWKSPWRRDSQNICSMAKLGDYLDDGPVLEEMLDGETLRPGDLVRGGVRRSSLERMARDGCPGGAFSYLPCIAIEHSQSDREICKVIK